MAFNNVFTIPHYHIKYLLLTYEVFNDTVINISSVVPTEQHLPLVVQEIYCTASHDVVRADTDTVTHSGQVVEAS